MQPVSIASRGPAAESRRARILSNLRATFRPDSPFNIVECDDARRQGQALALECDAEHFREGGVGRAGGIETKVRSSEFRLSPFDEGGFRK
jgi:hypothetical protein